MCKCDQHVEDNIGNGYNNYIAMCIIVNMSMNVYDDNDEDDRVNVDDSVGNDYVSKDRYRNFDDLDGDGNYIDGGIYYGRYDDLLFSTIMTMVM